MNNSTIILNFVNMIDSTDKETIKETIKTLISYATNSKDDGVLDIDKINRHKKILIAMLAEFEKAK